MNALDFFIIKNAALCFGVYMIGHMTVFRLVHPENIIHGLIKLFIAAAAINCILSGLFVRSSVVLQPTFSAADALLACTVSLIMLGMVCFLYVIGIFGPYETSVRIRLIRELRNRGSTGATLEDIIRDYRDTLMVQKRLKRLVGSGELVYQDGVYRIGKTLNIFSVIDFVTGLLRKAYGRVEEKE